MLSAMKMYFFEILTLKKDGADRLSRNIGMELPFYNPYSSRRDQVLNMFNFSASFQQENAKWSNINVFYNIISENTVQKGKFT
jgi:hypothetical protein